jgi:hypothetical protein
LNQIEARKTLVKTVQIYCAAMKKRIGERAHSPR